MIAQDRRLRCPQGIGPTPPVGIATLTNLRAPPASRTTKGRTIPA